MSDISEAERLTLITHDQVRLVNIQANLLETALVRAPIAALERDRRAVAYERDSDEEAAAFAKHRAHQRQPQRLPHVCTVLPFNKRPVA